MFDRVLTVSKPAFLVVLKKVYFSTLTFVARVAFFGQIVSAFQSPPDFHYY